MPSITYWNRIEPRPRSTDVGEALAARVRDPAWLLARQWQLGEFKGEDAASPAYIRVHAQTGDLMSWGTPGAYQSDVDRNSPIERYVSAEPWSPGDVTRAVEVGQALDRALVDLNALDLRPHFLAAYPILPGDESEPQAARLRALWVGRCIDGLAAFRATTQPVPPPPPGTPPGTPPPPAGTPWSVPLDRRTVANTAIVRTAVWVYDALGAPGTADPVGWKPSDLAFDVRVYASAPEGTGFTLMSATPDRRGDLAWHAFDHVDEEVPVSGPPDPVVSSIQRAVIPHHVRFRGMPNERFWDFEDGRFDVAAIRPDRRNLASMLLADFMLVHGNDWYLIPFDQPVGTVCKTEMIVVDVFGESTLVPRADAEPLAPEARRFSMFSIARSDGGYADFFMVPLSATTSLLESQPLEQVRFLRDDTANLVWAVEHAVEGILGRPVRAADRAPDAAALQPPPAQDGGLRYRIQSALPPHWFPFVPVKTETADHQIALELAAVLPLDEGSAVVPAPRGRILAPQAIASGTPYRVREEQVPREGTRITRIIRRSRGADGSTHVWLSRARSIGSGEGWSGLRFDLADTAEPANAE